jgi:YidC/Oxa1 family membrane protein insertase
LDKEMQRNLVLACVITVAITVLWYWLIGPKVAPQPGVPAPAPPAETETVEPEQKAEEPAPTEKPPSPLPTVEVDEELENARDVVLETPLVEATFTTLGARLKSLKLKEFPYKKGGVVDLVAQYDQGDHELPLSMTLDEDVGGDVVNRVNFECRQDGDSLTFERALPNGVFVSKEVRFKRDTYDIGLTIRIENRQETAVYVGEDEEPSYTLWWGPGIETTESDRYNRTLVAAMNEGKFLHRARGGFRGVKSVETYRQLSWLGLKSRYFVVLVVPLQEAPSIGRVVPVGTTDLGIELRADSFRLDPGETARNEYDIYAGPQNMTLLKEAGHELERAVNFGAFDGFSKVMLKVLKLCYRVVPNYGLGIILLTILVRVVMYPLTRKSMESMKKMQELQPEIAKLREKYKDNPQELNKRTMQFYKERGVNPMGGCLPMMIQMPIWIALFGMLRGAIELRGAPFFAWIDDLSEADTVTTLPFNLPFFGDELHVLPLLMAAAMFMQQKLSSPTAGAQTEQQKMMMFMFPVMFGFLFYHMPSGLCLYILVSTLLYFGQHITSKSGLFRRKQQGAPAK